MKKNSLISLLRTLCLTALLGMYSVNASAYYIWDRGYIDPAGDSGRKILVVDKDANEASLDCTEGKAIIILPGVEVTITEKFRCDGSIYVFGTLNSKVELLGAGTIYVMKGGSFNYAIVIDDVMDIRTNVELSDVLGGMLVSGQAPTQWEAGWKDYYEGGIVCGDDFYPMGYYEDKACTKKIDDIEAWKKGDGKVTYIEMKREAALAAIENAMNGTELTDEEQAAINGYIASINDTDDINEIERDLNAAILVIEKRKAFNAIQTAMDGETSDYLTGLVQSYINTINSADNTAIIDEAKAAAVAILTAAMPTYKTIKAEGKAEGKAQGKEEALSGFGSMLTPHSGPTINVVSNDGTKVKLYNVKGVEYKK